MQARVQQASAQKHLASTVPICVINMVMSIYLISQYILVIFPCLLCFLLGVFDGQRFLNINGMQLPGL